jgi:hypothetical protein
MNSSTRKRNIKKMETYGFSSFKRTRAVSSVEEEECQTNGKLKLIVTNKYDKKRKCGSDESAGRCEK